MSRITEVVIPTYHTDTLLSDSGGSSVLDIDNTRNRGPESCVTLELFLDNLLTLDSRSSDTLLVTVNGEDSE